MVITISIFAFLHHGDINRHFCNISASSRRVSPWLQSHRDENLDDIGHGGAWCQVPKNMVAISLPFFRNYDDFETSR